MNAERVRNPHARRLWVGRILTAAALVLTAALLPEDARALSTDAEQPLKITADRANHDERAGVTIYRGNVRITQGSIVVTGETVTSHTVDNELDRIEAKGDPGGKTTWRQLADDGSEMRAEARHMEYFAARRFIILTGEAILWRGDDRFSGERIEYDLERELMEAVSSGQQRIEAIIQPREEGSP